MCDHVVQACGKQRTREDFRNGRDLYIRVLSSGSRLTRKTKPPAVQYVCEAAHISVEYTRAILRTLLPYKNPKKYMNTRTREHMNQPTVMAPNDSSVLIATCI